MILLDLPKDFQSKMKELLHEEYEAFSKSYEEDKAQGLRINTLKVPVEDFLKITPFTLEKIPWVKEGFFYGTEDRPGKHPFHEAGLYYIQEPSAMAVGEMMDAQPGDKVLDLCAAPGGKTTHMAVGMQNKGFLLANEIHPLRAKILSQNIERMGITNAVVTNETPERLAQRFPSYFDRILVDAPCSGEGMFRKDPQACAEWSLENVAVCSSRQQDILEHASTMLRPGGRLVYSTCTFSPEENEGVISQFIQSNPYFEIEDIQVYEGFGKGRVDWIDDGHEQIGKTVRIWPHQVQGEGHYLAVLKKTDGEEVSKLKIAKVNTKPSQLKEFNQFTEETLMERPQGNFLLFGDQLYILPEEMLSLEKLKVVRPGWHLGTMKKNRFEPSHAMALSLNGSQVKKKWNLQPDSREIISYLKGESIQADGPKGWYLIEVGGFSIGWGKLSQSLLKNHFPKGLRWTGV
ncbi:RsmF rRNA methyltransferase first C-terminal domain-containing protein [Bacillus carboniphilus]|uniref:RsmF rRNA methyltransferase first C-terminal domain-containing protein n=1 Tax=Bacillus carboniphilus TaxID=86663 RepID=UPI0031D83BF0